VLQPPSRRAASATSLSPGVSGVGAQGAGRGARRGRRNPRARGRDRPISGRSLRSPESGSRGRRALSHQAERHGSATDSRSPGRTSAIVATASTPGRGGIPHGACVASRDAGGCQCGVASRHSRRLRQNSPSHRAAGLEGSPRLEQRTRPRFAAANARIGPSRVGTEPAANAAAVWCACSPGRPRRAKAASKRSRAAMAHGSPLRSQGTAARRRGEAPASHRRVPPPREDGRPPTSASTATVARDSSEPCSRQTSRARQRSRRASSAASSRGRPGKSSARFQPPSGRGGQVDDGSPAEAWPEGSKAWRVSALSGAEVPRQALRAGPRDSWGVVPALLGPVWLRAPRRHQTTEPFLGAAPRGTGPRKRGESPRPGAAREAGPEKAGERLVRPRQVIDGGPDRQGAAEFARPRGPAVRGPGQSSRWALGAGGVPGTFAGVGDRARAHRGGASSKTWRGPRPPGTSRAGAATRIV